MKHVIAAALLCMFCLGTLAHAEVKTREMSPVTVLDKPKAQDPAQSTINAEEPSPPEEGWHRYATEAYVGDYYYDAGSFAINTQLGLVTVAVRITESEDSAQEREPRSFEGEAWIDLRKGTVYKDIAFQDIDDRTGERKAHQQRGYTIDSESEKGILMIARRWALNHAKEIPKGAPALGTIELLKERHTWFMHAHSPWAQYYYAPSSITFERETARFELLTRIESTMYGRTPAVIAVLQKRGIENNFKMKTSRTLVDLEAKELLFVDYYLTVDDVATTPSEGIPIQQAAFSKDQKKVFDLVFAWAKNYLAKNPADRKIYKARYPRSILVR